MNTFLVTVGVGLATAAILALSAVAFTLEYAVSRIANFAHGEFLTIGTYAAYSTQGIFHQNVAAAALIAAAAGALVRWADVLVEDFRPGVMDRLGLGDDRLAELNPRPGRVRADGD